MRRNTKLTTLLALLALTAALALAGCSAGAEAAQAAATTAAGVEVAMQEPAGTSTGGDDAAESASEVVSTSDEIVGSDEWDEDSHGKDADPDYDVVFPQDAVNTITITINPDNWALMQADMTDLYGEFGTRQDMGGGPGGGRGPGGDGELPEGFEPPAEGEMPEDFQPPADGEMPEGFGEGRGPGGGGGMPGGGMMGGGENPMWVTADIEFNGQTWSNVGMRFKGNSSLSGGWGSGVLKLGFKLDFDEFEDDYPQIEDQRFYGFKQLSFSSNYNDDSLLREKVTADIFREAGVPAAETAFYAVYVDYGEGPVYFGLYTAVEVVDDTVIETQFADDGGNVYKPEGNAATFAEGTFDEESFDKETNQDEADYSDVLALYEALHADTRTTDPEAWRADLEAVFDADGFIHWLAVNTVVQNWDTYGQMSHNYYLYNDPSTGQLTWIPWDNNFALGGMGGMGGGRGPGGSTSDSLGHENVGENWPLIRYLLDDPAYHDLYVSYVADTVENVFAPEKMAETYTALHDLIAPYVVGENGEQEGYTYLSSDDAFDTALTGLIEHAQSRYELAQDYLSGEEVE